MDVLHHTARDVRVLAAIVADLRLSAADVFATARAERHVYRGRDLAWWREAVDAERAGASS